MMKQKNYEPKMCNRFGIKFPEDLFLPDWANESASRPSIKIENGKLIIEPITLIFYDNIAQSTAQSLILLLDSMYYKEPTFLEKIYNYITNNKVRSKMKGNPILGKYSKGFDFELDMLDPVGVTVEKWVLNACKITSIDFGRLSGDNNSIAKIKMVVQPKFFDFHF